MKSKKAELAAVSCHHARTKQRRQAKGDCAGAPAAGGWYAEKAEARVSTFCYADFAHGGVLLQAPLASYASLTRCRDAPGPVALWCHQVPSM